MGVADAAVAAVAVPLPLVPTSAAPRLPLRLPPILLRLLPRLTMEPKPPTPPLLPVLLRVLPPVNPRRLRCEWSRIPSLPR